LSDNLNNKTEKLTDKAFIRLVITSFLAVVLCVTCLCGASWAWFSGSTTSTGNEITTAICELKIFVNDGSSTELAAVTVDSEAILSLDAGNYTVVMTLPQDSASGYSVITVDGISYYSEALISSSDPVEQTLTFNLTLESEHSVKVAAHWGIYSGTIDVSNSGTLIIP